MNKIAHHRIAMIPILIILAFTTAFGQTIDDEASNGVAGLNIGFETDFASKYIWRGLAWSSGSVSQNSAWVTRGNLTGSIWSNYDFKAGTGDPRFNELDLAMAYGASLKALTFESSLQAYFYPNQKDSPSTAEFSIDISCNTPIIQPFTIQTLDIKAYQGAYYGELGLRSSWDLSEKFNIEASSEIGWGSRKFNETYIGESASAVELASLEAGVTWNFSSSFYIRPHIIVSSIIDDRIKALVEKPNLFQAGVAVGGEF